MERMTLQCLGCKEEFVIEGEEATFIRAEVERPCPECGSHHSLYIVCPECGGELKELTQ